MYVCCTLFLKRMYNTLLLFDSCACSRLWKSTLSHLSSVMRSCTRINVTSAHVDILCMNTDLSSCSLALQGWASRCSLSFNLMFTSLYVNEHWLSSSSSRLCPSTVLSFKLFTSLYKNEHFAALFLLNSWSLLTLLRHSWFPHAVPQFPVTCLF